MIIPIEDRLHSTTNVITDRVLESSGYEKKGLLLLESYNVL